MIDIEKLKYRYQKNYVTDAQLDRYVNLGAITEEQAKEIRASKEI